MPTWHVVTQRLGKLEAADHMKYIEIINARTVEYFGVSRAHIADYPRRRCHSPYWRCTGRRSLWGEGLGVMAHAMLFSSTSDSAASTPELGKRFFVSGRPIRFRSEGRYSPNPRRSRRCARGRQSRGFIIRMSLTKCGKAGRLVAATRAASASEA